MKIVGRATLWLIDKLVYLLIGKKDFTPTPVPDDWPPDGSMHFLRFDHPIGLTGLPPNAVQYEFAANVGEDDPVVFSLGQEIISRLCDSRKTLIVFSFDHELPKNKRQEKKPAHLRVCYSVPAHFSSRGSHRPKGKHRGIFVYRLSKKSFFAISCSI